MGELVILNSPLFLLGYGLAALLCLLDGRLKSPGGLLTLLSAVVGVVTTTLALLRGAEAGEVVCALLVLLLCALPVFWRKGGDE